MYASYFGLSETAFNITPDPRFLYVNECYQEAIAALRYGIDARKGFIALVGEAGTGKTTMLRRLMDALDPSCRTVLLLHPTVSFDEILEHILQELGIPVDGARKLTMLQRLHEFLIEHTLAGGNVALLIDESQDLQTSVLEELRLLSNLETGKEKILQIVLAGQTELDQKFADPSLRQLRQRITLQIRLRQLRPAEVSGYIDARLARVGGQVERIFEPDAVARIAAVSNGIPRVVNVICDATMLHAFATESPRVTARIVDEAWADYSRGYHAMEHVPLVPAQAVRQAAIESPPPVAAAPPPPAVPPAVPPVLPPPPDPIPIRLPECDVSAAPAEDTPLPPVVPNPPPPPPPEPVEPPAAILDPPPAPDPAALSPAMTAPAEPPASPWLWRVSVSAAIVAAVLYGFLGPLWQASKAVPTAVPPPAVASVPAPALPPPTSAALTIPPATLPVPLAALAEPLTPAEARTLVESFRTAYEERNVDALGRLLAADVVHNTARGRTRVLGDYQAAFADIDQIEYRLPNVQVALRDERTIVSSPFIITYQERDGRRQQLTGAAEWRVERRDGQPLIAALTYRFDS